MRNSQVIVLAATDVSSQTGSAISVGQAVSASFVPKFGDITAAGTLKIQASNDNPGTQQNFVPTNWADIPNATSTITAGVAPAIVISNMCFAYIRVVTTITTPGSTTVSVAMNVLSV